MTRFRSLIAGLALSLTVLAPAAAQIPQPPEIAARAYLLLDVTTGQVLASKDPDASVEPASLTKLMSAYLVFDALRAGKITLTQTFGVSERAWKTPGSRMFIEPRMQVPVEDLIKGMIVQSGNDATVALAEGVAGSVDRFVELMNQQAKALGMTATGYRNPEGLTAPGHVTTARDLATLSTRLINDFPQYVGYYSIQRYRYPGTPATNDTNRNLLLFRDPTVDGLKTGHTDAAGYCLVATARRPVPGLGDGPAGQRRLLSVMLGTSSENARAAESQKLLNWGYTAFDTVRLLAANQPAAEPRIWKGKSDTVKLGRAEGVIVSVPAGEGAKLKSEVVRPDPLVAPLQKGQGVGTLRVTTASGQPVVEVPLTVLETVEEAGIFGRAWDAIRLWIQ
ncbi:MAG: D-alanyl-D-alanine carboxypeptidase [Xanthomonadales bacterium]|uniref:D-alanyl-D-alanine carboxypeptidase family protein n=1 Tax=Hydrogenophaga sp. TaxID=1904254 RepID=UPI0016A4CBCF|nr:D-alanyl-D-alanine carboxypeptidase family protein [Hydrogenophaga sp.]NIQ36718.1 D-alanyl-D-alanine carboxypeptidase [Xanthomonadales bacterium]NIM41986.1 D-alanyl-D-alanine carboxypeptidase [Hydrogenophaga sp.]NIN27289.1 D-alanyl-D-alanine carboxypeptidase [Hydrogenophaga sp.]NIN31990.1 D-alanyl-D-alanine carboxypeptidase [Hydrogenophaga sp.]NIN56142.1 D-alanyl-D-alanine carboxypeptidase [Hydrogenophaga sp.]